MNGLRVRIRGDRRRVWRVAGYASADTVYVHWPATGPVSIVDVVPLHAIEEREEPEVGWVPTAIAA